MESLGDLSPFMKIYILVVTGIVGLVIGSFLNVVALRLLCDESFVFPPSRCPNCKKSIAWYDNIPVLSYFLLRAKCRNCKESISIQYPIVELATGILFVAVVYVFGLTLNTLFLLVLVCGLVIITITDIREKLIFDLTTVPLIPLGLIYNFFDVGNTGRTVTVPLEGINTSIVLNEIFISAVIGAIIGAAFFEISSRLGLLLVGEYAFGSGDSIIAAALGAWFGWQMILVILAISFIAQLFIGIPVILMNMYKDKDHKSLIAMGFLLFSIVIPYIGKQLGLVNTLIGALGTTLLALGVAIGAIFVIMRGLRERQSFTFLPFGPALVIGGLVVMFSGQEVLNWYLNSL
ncbi:MAG: Peptidase A24A protein [uncultured bacterium]|nr:MAG: Peptidase A24A protein [uncultured bacterium]HBH18732.1 hypothetical protein [Cyanobacteria bacterium UBA9579]